MASWSRTLEDLMGRCVAIQKAMVSCDEALAKGDTARYQAIITDEIDKMAEMDD